MQVITEQHGELECSSKDSARITVPTAREIFFPDSRRDNEQQEMIEKEFFSSIRLKNGTYKYTYSNRLDDLNALVNTILPDQRPLRLMDVAVSSGVSTLEWVESLRQLSVAHEMVAGDRSVNAFLFSRGKNLHVLVDDTGYPLQFEIKGVAIPNPTGNRNLLRHPLALNLIRSSLARSFASMSAQCSENGEEASVRSGNVRCRRVQLISPRVKSSGLKIVQDDILTNDAFTRSFHVVRAANILNPTYFDEPTLEEIVVKLRNRLLPGGLFVVCRTDDAGRNNGTTFHLTDAGRFELKARLNNGVDVEDLVLRTPAKPTLSAQK